MSGRSSLFLEDDDEISLSDEDQGFNRSASEDSDSEWQARGRTLRKTVRCEARPPCGHYHTTASTSVCRRDGSRHICCHCDGSAYTCSQGDPTAMIDQVYAESSGSRESSRERKTKDVKNLIANEIVFNDAAAAYKTLGADEAERVPPFERDVFERDPEKFTRLLVKSNDDRVKKIVDILDSPDSQARLREIASDYRLRSAEQYGHTPVIVRASLDGFITYSF
ncbi:hypothetical protein H9Q69_000959 [Fusarium xylarioides]|uniref:Uncharacterized protein n=1 Tax=Fusarium xylarioides TaxID=221167 RepID=A0A9P7LAL1_9HYPO|nr:hypothetical protein H9Q72_001601 [Fusarium xylarioides]KAG5799991.1 hypothetical protein H9Q69_000959 [Fusarium xylarioides]KAG5826867.1 hypothetical protein H9Q74_003056 [Fusarium xylarioides]